MEQINEFFGGHRFLSNFYPAKVVLGGIEYPTVENAYQAAKTETIELRKQFIDITPGQAKRLGRTLPIVNNWGAIKVSIMRNLLVQKFRHPALRKLLIATGDMPLIERNSWHDNFWGSCSCHRCASTLHQNVLGELLMEIRSRCLED